LPTSLFGLIDVLTPNETEARVLAGRAPEVSVDPEAVAQELMCRGVKHVVMTLGERGAMLISGSSCTHFSAVQVRASDTTGASDAFNAGLATALAQGSDIGEATQFAVIVGAMSVTRDGVIPSLPRRNEIREFCSLHKLITPTWLGFGAPGSGS
jgi:ribokinase